MPIAIYHITYLKDCWSGKSVTEDKVFFTSVARRLVVDYIITIAKRTAPSTVIVHTIEGDVETELLF